MPTIVKRKPATIIHPDISILSREDWLELRRNGIGGSDAGTIMGVNPYSTLRDLYYDKKGITTSNEEDNWIAKEYGHILEDLVARVFAKETGFRVWQDNAMYAHPDYPFMLANLDRLTIDLSGQTCGLECKTGSPDTRFRWENGGIPYWYELQCRHYMAVKNLDRYYIACLFGNRRSDFVWRRIDRDYDLEAELIDMEEHFWLNYYLADVPPPLTEKPDLCIQSIQRYFSTLSAPVNTILLPTTCHADFKEIERLKKEKKELESQKREIDACIKAKMAILLDQMGSPGNATCTVGGETFQLEYEEKEQIVFQKESINKMKAAHPSIFDAFAEHKTKIVMDITKIK